MNKAGKTSVFNIIAKAKRDSAAAASRWICRRRFLLEDVLLSTSRSFSQQTWCLQYLSIFIKEVNILMANQLVVQRVPQNHPPVGSYLTNEKENVSGETLTFKTSSSKHCSTFTFVLALHSIKRHPHSLAKSIPSFLLTTLSLS